MRLEEEREEAEGERGCGQYSEESMGDCRIILWGGSGEAGCDPQKGGSLSQPADGDGATANLKRNCDGEEDHGQREVDGGSRSRLPETHQSEINDCEENGDPGEEIV